MKYVLYESKAEQSYTLLKKAQNPRGIVEDDAVIIHEITAKNWDDALDEQDRLLYEDTK
jgi:hypothetical protein